MQTPTQIPRQHKPDWLNLFAWLCAAVAFSPFVIWLAKEIAVSRQLSDALVILVSMGIVLALDNKVKPHSPRFAKKSVGALALAYAAFIAAPYCGKAAMPIALGGLALFVMAVGFSCLNSPRFVFAAGAAFYAFVLLSLFISAFDLPLRVLAGDFSVWILKFFNPSAMLVTLANQPPQIGMIAYGKTYLVATECNGFGLISSCTVLSVLFAAFRKNNFLKRILIVAGGISIAIFANALRIVSIVVVAPHFSQAHYSVVHEACGYFFFALALLGVWKLAKL